MRRRRSKTAVAFAVTATLVLPLLAQTPRPTPPRTTAPARPAATPAPRGEAQVPFKVGETLNYDVSWSSFVVAGTARVTVRGKAPSAGSVAYQIVAEGQPTPLVARLYSLYYKADTRLDAYTLLSQQASIFSQEGGRRRTKLTKFDRNARRVTYEVQTATRTSTTFPIAPQTQDLLATLFAIRTLPLKANLRTVIPVTDSGDTFDVQVTVGGREPVAAAGRSITAWKVLPVVLEGGRPAGDRKMALWISDDAKRLPLRLQAEFPVGTFNLTLTSASGI